MRETLRAILRTLQWQRGLRTLVAVGSAMVVCHLLGKPPGAAALGGFDALLVDNGGPYRTRLTTMATTLAGGALALVLGSLVPPNLAVAVLVTMAVCFALTFARVLSQPIASSSVLILVLYFAGLGGVQHTLAGALFTAQMFLLGGLWAVLLSLMLWPLDPFRPARLAVAKCFAALASFSGALEFSLSVERSEQQRDVSLRAAYDWRRQQRIRMEAGRAALVATAARAPSRTIRARNLTVLLETSDLLMARLIRITELADLARVTQPADAVALEARLCELTQWLSGAERAVSFAIEQRPADTAASFARDGSQWMQFITRRHERLKRHNPTPGTAIAPVAEHLYSEERDALLEMEAIFDAVRAIWTGAEVKLPAWSGLDAGLPDSTWLDALTANWTMNSVMFRHALRLVVVGAVDVLAMRAIHINHGFWLPMTSIILLQPYSAGTARKSMQRITGTIAGGIFAAVLAAAVSDQLAMIAIITVLASLTVATFAVDYAVYSFFLTPTFVLLSLPHAHDWRYAGVRIGTTLLGAAIAILAMRLLWPERAEEELGRLLRRGAAACAAYVRAVERFWQAPATGRRAAERTILAPARRACGLASNDAEEAVDRVLQEPHFGRQQQHDLRLNDEALTFATYLRRLTQSTTTLAFVGQDAASGASLAQARLERIAARLDHVAQPAAPTHASAPPAGEAPLSELAEVQLKRLERQAGILERAAEALTLR